MRTCTRAFLALILALGLPGAIPVHAQEYADSEIRTVTTRSVEAPVTYVFFCRATSDTSILLSWVGTGPSELHRVNVYGSDDPGILERLNPSSFSPGAGSYEWKNLTPNTNYYAQLEIDYSSSPPNDEKIPASPLQCRTLVNIVQDPALLAVVPLGPNSLYVTWKDNAVRSHDFRLERIKVTPETPAFSSVTRNGAKQAVLTWTNDTNMQTYKSPYYHVIERSSNNSFTPFQTFFVSFAEDTDYSATRTGYSWVDSDTPAGETWYRIKACSIIKADYDGNGTPDEACSAWSEVKKVNLAAYVTPSETVASLFDTMRATLRSLVRRIGQSFSKSAAGATVDLNAYYAQFSQPLTFTTNPGVYRDNGLVADSVYLYRVKAIYTDAAGGETSYTNEGAGKTLNAGATTPVTVRICVRNNLCGTTTGFSGGGEAPTNQCTTNNDCRNVGTTRQFFEER